MQLQKVKSVIFENIHYFCSAIIPDVLPGLSADGPAFSPVLPPGSWKQENALVSFIITKKSEK